MNETVERLRNEKVTNNKFSLKYTAQENETVSFPGLCNFLIDNWSSNVKD